MPQTILGVDIGSFSIKVAQIRRSFKSFELVKFFERQIQYNDLLTPEEATSAAITALIEDNNLGWDQIIVGLPGQFVSSRLIELPFANKKKIDQTIEFEMENYIPFDVSEVVADYHIVKAGKDSSKVLVFYAPKSQFVKTLNLLEKASIDPKVVCVEGVELVNLVNLGMVPPEGVYAMLDIGHKKTTITICKGKSLYFTRTIMIGGWHITDAIAKKLGVSYDEAEKLKIEMGQISDIIPDGLDSLSKNVFEAINHVVDSIVLHLRQTFFSYQDDAGDVVSGIYLSGGTSRLPGLDRYLSIKLKQNVAFLDCLEFHFSRLTASDVHLQLIPQALALGLRGVAPAGLPDVNFRKGEFAYKGDVKQLGGGLRRAGIAIVLVVALAIVYFTVNYLSLSKKLAELNREISSLVVQAIPDANPKKISNSNAALNFIKSKKNETGERLAKLSAALGNSSLNILKEISSSFPSRDEIKVDIEDFNYQQGKIKLSGRTTSFEAVDKLKSSLERNSKFKNVATGNVRKGVKDEIKFDITMETGK